MESEAETANDIITMPIFGKTAPLPKDWKKDSRYKPDR